MAETAVAGTRGISLAVVDGFAEASDETMLEISEEAPEGAMVVEGREDRTVVEAEVSDRSGGESSCRRMA